MLAHPTYPARPRSVLAPCLLALGLLLSAAAGAAEITFLEQSLELPGAPAALVPLDLDGDGLADLVTVTNDVTFLKTMAILPTRRLTLDLGFHPWCQGPDGRFTRAPGPPLESRLTIHLNDLELLRRSLFAGELLVLTP